MLSAIERIAFILLILFSMSLSYVTFSRMFKIIGRGTQPLNWKSVLKKPRAGDKVDHYRARATTMLTRGDAYRQAYRYGPSTVVEDWGELGAVA